MKCKVWGGVPEVHFKLNFGAHPQTQQKQPRIKKRKKRSESHGKLSRLNLGGIG